MLKKKTKQQFSSSEYYKIINNKVKATVQAVENDLNVNRKVDRM